MNSTTETLPASDYNVLCSFLGTGIKGRKVQRVTEYTIAPSVVTFEIVNDVNGVYVDRIVDGKNQGCAWAAQWDTTDTAAQQAIQAQSFIDALTVAATDV